MGEIEDTIAHAALAVRVVRVARVATVITSSVSRLIEARSKEAHAEAQGVLFQKAISELAPDLEVRLAELFADRLSVDEMQAVLSSGTDYARRLAMHELGIDAAVATVGGEWAAGVSDRATALCRLAGGR